MHSPLLVNPAPLSPCGTPVTSRPLENLPLPHRLGYFCSVSSSAGIGHRQRFARWVALLLLAVCLSFLFLHSSLLRKRRMVLLQVCIRLFLDDCQREVRCIVSRTALDRAQVAPSAPLVGIDLDIAFPCTPCRFVATAFRSFRAAIRSAIIVAPFIADLPAPRHQPCVPVPLRS